jgi:hypothetical protein
MGPGHVLPPGRNVPARAVSAPLFFKIFKLKKNVNHFAREINLKI